MKPQLPPHIEEFMRSQLALEGWPQLPIDAIMTKEVMMNGCTLRVMHNPARRRSALAQIDERSLAARRCFLCPGGRLAEQRSMEFCGMHLMVNPYPIFSPHFVIISPHHEPQQLAGHARDMARLAAALPGFTLWYNGPLAGATAPDHFHFQAVPTCELPMWKWEHDPFLIHRAEASSEEVIARSLDDIMSELGSGMDREADVNVLMCRNARGMWRLAVVPRKAHRPQCYLRGEVLISPGSSEVGGVVVAHRLEDYNRADESLLTAIYSDTCFLTEN